MIDGSEKSSFQRFEPKRDRKGISGEFGPVTLRKEIRTTGKSRGQPMVRTNLRETGLQSRTGGISFNQRENLVGLVINGLTK